MWCQKALTYVLMLGSSKESEKLCSPSSIVKLQRALSERSAAFRFISVLMSKAFISHNGFVHCLLFRPHCILREMFLCALFLFIDGYGKCDVQANVCYLSVCFTLQHKVHSIDGKKNQKTFNSVTSLQWAPTNLDFSTCGFTDSVFFSNTFFELWI